MALRLQRINKHSAVLLSLALGAVVLTAALSILLRVVDFSDNEGGPTEGVATESTLTSGQAGGGGAAPADLIAVRDALPKIPGFAPDAVDIYTGGDVLEAIYWVKDAPGEVISYYQSKMVLLGWQQLEPASTTTSELSEQGQGRVALSVTFAKDNFRVTVGVGENTIKDPERGTTRVGFLIERVKAP